MSKPQKKQPSDGVSLSVSVPRAETAQNDSASAVLPSGVPSTLKVMGVRFVSAVNLGTLGPKSQVATSNTAGIQVYLDGVSIAVNSYSYFVPMSNINAIQYLTE